MPVWLHVSDGLPSDVALFRIFFNQGDELVDVALYKAAGGLDEFAAVVKQGGGVAEEGFGLSGQRHIEVGQGQAQVFLRAIAAHFADGMADDAGGRVFPSDVGVGFGADVYRVFQAGGHGAVVFGGNEQNAV